MNVSPGRLTARDLARPFHGVRVRGQPSARDAAATTEREPGSPDELAREAILARRRAHSLVLPPHAFYVGAAALAAHGLPFLDASEAETAPLEVAVFAPHRALRRPGIAAFRVQPGLAHTVTKDGLRVASPASLWALLARDHSTHDLIRIGDAMVRIPRDDWGRRHPEWQLVSIDRLGAAIDAGRRLGAAALREALPQLRTGSMSVLETDWRLGLSGTGLPEPELDVEVRSPQGRLLGISDAAFPAYRVAVEIEGDHHRTSRRQWVRDLQKYADYAAIGWEVVRLASSHIRPARRTDVELVAAALTRRGWRG